MQHAQGTALKPGGVFARLDAFPARLHSQHLHGRISQKRIKQPNRIRPAAHAGHEVIGQAAFPLHDLGADFPADDGLEIAHHDRVGKRPQGRAQDVVRVFQVLNPVFERGVDRVLQGLRAVGDRDDLGAEELASLQKTLGSLGGFVLWKVAPAPAENELGEAVLFRADTQYHRITVTEGDGARHLRFDRSHQSAISLEDPYESRIRYPDYMHLAMALKPDAERVLVLGLGGGAITKRFWRDYPGVTVDTVEIDPVVAEVARKYFWLPEDERSRVYIEDARRYVQSTGETYDIVIVDAYYADALPFHLTTDEFLREIKAVMAPDGVLAYNVISTTEGHGSDLFRSMYRTAEGVWNDIWVFPIGIGEDGVAETRRNIIVLATDTRVTEDVLRDTIASRVDGMVSIDGFAEMADDLYVAPVEVADVPLLTDSHAPTVSLIQVQ
mgnify:CR=1 FL=1